MLLPLIGAIQQRYAVELIFSFIRKPIDLCLNCDAGKIRANAPWYVVLFIYRVVYREFRTSLCDVRGLSVGTGSTGSPYHQRRVGMTILWRSQHFSGLRQYQNTRLLYRSNSSMSAKSLSHIT